MRAVLIGFLVLLSACATEEQAKQDREAIKQQLSEDGRYIAGQTKANAKLVEDNATKHTMRIANNIRDGVKKTNRKVRDWWLEPLPEKRDQPIPVSYCYSVLQDVLCYRQPMPGWEHRLVGYQGTGAEPPPPAVMQPLPVSTIDGRQEIENRIAGAKPVFVEPPAGTKPEEGSEQDMLDGALSREALPNPMLSPQL